MGKGSNKTTTTSQQQYTPDPRISAAAGQALTGAQSAAQLPFQMPAAPVAGFSPFQEQAFGQIQGMQGMSLPYFNAAANYMQGSAAPISGADVEQYYNPMAQNITNQLQNIFGQQNKMATSNAVRAAGGVGADRIAVAQGNLANQQTLGAGQIYAGLYDKALQAAQQQKQMMAGAGFGLGQLGPAAQSSYLQGTGALGQAGAQQQALSQAQQNALYQQRLAEIAYPFQTPQYLAGIAGGLAPALGGSTSGTSTTTQPQPSPLNQILGIGGALLGGFMGGPMGAMAGGSLGGAMGGKGSGGGMTAGYGPGSLSYYGGTPYMQFRRGGRAFASGGSTYGRLAEQRFANSPIGNPYADSSDDEGYDDGGQVNQRFAPQPMENASPPIQMDRFRPQMQAPPQMPMMDPRMARSMPQPYNPFESNESLLYGYAEGGEVEERPSLPGSKPLPMDTMSIVPKIPLRMGAGHAGAKLNLSPPAQKSSGSSTAGQIANIASKVLPMLMAAQGGAVNPFDAGQGFQEGGLADDELLQGIDAPMGNTNPHWSMGDVASKAADYYGPMAKRALGAINPDRVTMDPSKLWRNETGGPPIRQGREGIAELAPEEQQSPFAADEIPLPRGNPRTVGGIKATMANEWSRAGMPPTGISGINMNVADESQFDPSSRHFDQPRFRGTEAENAHGLYQEGGDEWNNYVGWLKKNRPDYNWNDPALQSRFTAQNLRENYPQVWDAMTKARSPGEAADIFLRGYLKPATQHLAARSRRYLGGEGGEGDDALELSGKPRNPFITANRDMTLESVMRSPQRPYPDATKRDWGQNLARSPWGALVVGGARMAQTVGPVGSALGAGIEAGMGHLSGQRKELRTEEDMNMKADALFQHAKTHLDKYQRMTPYEESISKWREAKAESPTALIKNAKWLVENGVAPDLETAHKMLSSGVNQPAVMERAIRAEKANLAKTPEGSSLTDAQLEALARKNVQERFETFAPRAKPKPTQADLDYVKAHPETAGKFRERFGIEPT